MQTLTEIRHLFEYNGWANRKAIQSIKDSSSQSTKAISALSHLLIAEKTWLVRMIDAEKASTEFWTETTLAGCEALADEAGGEYSEFVSALTEEKLDLVVSYTNSKGVGYRTPIREILTHVLMHSTYHRGQVAMAVRAAGDAPAASDYIIFVRELNAAREAAR